MIPPAEPLPAPHPRLDSDSREAYPLVVVAGPTASGKSALAVSLAETFGGEVISCDSVAIYHELNVGSAKPSAGERARVPHHGLDVLRPDEPTTAGDYMRLGRAVLNDVRARGRLPIVAGGTGLYLRALLGGLAPAPPRDEALRERLRALADRRGRGALHRLLRWSDPAAAGKIHPNDTPKLVRSLEMGILARRPQTEQIAQWGAGREALGGFRILRIGLDPPRSALYERIDARAAEMFAGGLLEETARVRGRYGPGIRSLGSLGYAQAGAVLDGRQGLAEAVAEAQTGHRNYAKRQLTWFRREEGIRWIGGFGDDPRCEAEARALVSGHLECDLQCPLERKANGLAAVHGSDERGKFERSNR